MLTLFNYCGKLSERLRWLKSQLPLSGDQWYLDTLPRLDPHTEGAEVPLELVGTEIDFALVDEMGCSLVGMARERCVEGAMAWGADYLLFFDADMHVPTSAILQLIRNDVSICGALAFTGRDPITPVIYDAAEVFQPDPERPGEGVVHLDYKPVLHYEKDALQQVDAIGSGCMLVKREAFEKIPKPWFYSTGIGEDIMFCLRAKRHGVPVYVDTRVKVPHLKTYADWQTEAKFLARVEREAL
jgi:GT2 family glycosyltransferase